MSDVGVTNALRGLLYPSLIPPIPHTSATERGVSVNLNFSFFFSSSKSAPRQITWAWGPRVCEGFWMGDMVELLDR